MGRFVTKFFDYFVRKKLNLGEYRSFRIKLELILISLFIDTYFQFVFFFYYIKFVYISLKNRFFFEFFIVCTIISIVSIVSTKTTFHFIKIKNISLRLRFPEAHLPTTHKVGKKRAKKHLDERKKIRRESKYSSNWSKEELFAVQRQFQGSFFF